ncbi:hypothetical protein CYMTET_52907 [Cymbomonas tetramitiformis]|uniref:Uncharacterized protein n=1 Tax=Cymbomonas tetramitiformis TaxID=36881 RepID=A0AAE0BIB4_9CHLO|nr:hypothetical protein CYMTET_52907 [Cymbomonas tetramitiformis]
MRGAGRALMWDAGRGMFSPGGTGAWTINESKLEAFGVKKEHLAAICQQRPIPLPLPNMPNSAPPMPCLTGRPPPHSSEATAAGDDFPVQVLSAAVSSAESSEDEEEEDPIVSQAVATTGHLVEAPLQSLLTDARACGLILQSGALGAGLRDPHACSVVLSARG